MKRILLTLIATVAIVTTGFAQEWTSDTPVTVQAHFVGKKATKEIISGTPGTCYTYDIIKSQRSNGGGKMIVGKVNVYLYTNGAIEIENEAKRNIKMSAIGIRDNGTRAQTDVVSLGADGGSVMQPFSAANYVKVILRLHKVW